MGNWLKIENLNLPPCRWVRQLQEELFQQGDQERALGLPLSPLVTPVTPPCRWVRQLQEEFFQQGDQERALGLPLSPLMDRTRAGVAKSQTHFFNAVAR